MRMSFGPEIVISHFFLSFCFLEAYFQNTFFPIPNRRCMPQKIYITWTSLPTPALDRVKLIFITASIRSAAFWNTKYAFFSALYSISCMRKEHIVSDSWSLNMIDAYSPENIKLICPPACVLNYVLYKYGPAKYIYCTHTGRC